MMRKASAVLLILLPAALLWQPAPVGPPRLASAAPAPSGNRTVYFGTGLSDEDTLVFTSAVAAADPWAVVLLDGPKAGKVVPRFLEALRPRSVIPVGPAAGATDELTERLGTKPAAALEWPAGPPESLWKQLFPQAPKVVVTPPSPRPLLLQAACLAGALRAPLYVTRGAGGSLADMTRLFTAWKTKEVYAAGGHVELPEKPSGLNVVRLADANEVSAAYVRELAKDGPVRNVVVANPDD